MGPTLNIELFLRSLNEAFVELLRIIISQKNWRMTLDILIQTGAETARFSGMRVLV